MRKITIIHPSRGRAALALSVINNWIGKADNPDNIEYLLSIDDDEHEVNAYLPVCKRTYKPIICYAFKNRSAIDAINIAATKATGDIFIVVSDDFDCLLSWDKVLLDAIGDRTDFVAKTWDGCQPWIITLPIMDRAYYNRFGYIYNPAYVHMFCDTEMSHVGDLLGRTIKLDITFPHKHYSQQGGIARDHVSIKNDATWNQGESVYLERMKDNFGIENPLPIQLPEHHINWLKSKGVIS